MYEPISFEQTILVARQNIVVGSDETVVPLAAVARGHDRITVSPKVSTVDIHVSVVQAHGNGFQIIGRVDS